jgi:reactive chlorine resistance protein C
MDAVVRLFGLAARADRIGLAVTRIGLVVVLVWIGGLKVYQYEATASRRSWPTARS